MAGRHGGAARAWTPSESPLALATTDGLGVEESGGSAAGFFSNPPRERRARAALTTCVRVRVCAGQTGDDLREQQAQQFLEMVTLELNELDTDGSNIFLQVRARARMRHGTHGSDGARERSSCDHVHSVSMYIRASVDSVRVKVV